MSTFSLPLSTAGAGEIEDATGGNIVEVWRRMPDGNFPPDFLSDKQEGALDALMEARAKEIVLRVNLHDELVDALLAMSACHAAMMAKVNHGASFYDADTVRLMNEAPGIASAVLAKLDDLEGEVVQTIAATLTTVEPT